MRRILATGVMLSLLGLAGGLYATEAALAGGGCHGEPGPEGAGTEVSIEGCAFQPSVLHVQPGESVTFTNDEGIPHTVTGGAWGDTTYLELGDSATYRFEAEGTFAYSCVLHPGMVGAVVVGNGSGDDWQAVKAAVPDEPDSSGGMPSWGLATVGALTGMVATGAAGLVLGKRRS